MKAKKILRGLGIGTAISAALIGAGAVGQQIGWEQATGYSNPVPKKTIERLARDYFSNRYAYFGRESLEIIASKKGQAKSPEEKRMWEFREIAAQRIRDREYVDCVKYYVDLGDLPINCKPKWRLPVYTFKGGSVDISIFPNNAEMRHFSGVKSSSEFIVPLTAEVTYTNMGERWRIRDNGIKGHIIMNADSLESATRDNFELFEKKGNIVEFVRVRGGTNESFTSLEISRHSISIFLTPPSYNPLVVPKSYNDLLSPSQEYGNAVTAELKQQSNARVFGSPKSLLFYGPYYKKIGERAINKKVKNAIKQVNILLPQIYEGAVQDYERAVKLIQDYERAVKLYQANKPKK